MNNARRKVINDSSAKIQAAKRLLNQAISTETAALHNIQRLGGSPESYKAIHDIVSSLKDAASSLDRSIESINQFDF
jgi:hypothetical protein